MPQDENARMEPPMQSGEEAGLGREVATLWWELMLRPPAPDWPLGWLLDRTCGQWR